MAQRPISLENAMALAKQAADKGDVLAARNLYKKILARDPGYKAARKALKKLPRGRSTATIQADTFKHDMERMMALHASGNLEEAMSLAIRLSRKYPNQPMPLNVQGSILFARAQYSDAVAILGKAHEMAPDYDSTLHNLGQALAQLDRTEEAMAMFNKALALNSNDATALTYKGNLLIDSNDYAEAKKYLEKALEINPYDANTQYYYGKLLFKTGLRKAALAHLRNALDIDPTKVEARATLGDTLAAMRLYTSAVDELAKAAELAPDNSAVQTSLGMALLYKGDHEKAIAAFENSINLNPASGQARHFLEVAKGNTSYTTPTDFVKELFDGYAGYFESSLVGNLGYDAPNTLKGLFDRVNSKTDLKVLDLGCGTGLAGVAFQDISSDLTGIDLSPKMLKTAAEKNLYSSLICEDAVKWLSAQDQTFDLVIAVDMLIYVGNLEPLFHAVRARCNSNSRLAFTTEVLADSADSADMQLLITGRYAHSGQYVERAAQECGFTIEESQNAPLRKERGQWLEGGYYILKAVARR